MEDPKLGHNKEQSFIEFSTHEGKMKIGKEGNVIFIEQNETKVYLTESITGPEVTALARTNNPIVEGDTPNENIDALDSAIGVDVAPVVRTNHPVVQNTTVLAKIGALDAAVGTDGDVAGVFTRTIGPIVANSTVNAKFKALDDVIGSDAQMPDSSKIVDHDLNIYQNLRALDTYKSVETIKKTIGGAGRKAMGTITVSGTPIADETMIVGGTTYTFKAARAVAGEITISANNATQVTNIVNAITADQVDITASDGAGDTVLLIAATPGVAGNALPLSDTATGIAVNGGGFMGGTTLGIDPPAADFNFAIADDQVEQVFDLGEIHPSLARIMDCFIRTNTEFANAVSLVAEVGTSSSGHEIINSGTVMAADAILAMAADHNMTIVPKVAAGHIYVAITPGANWSLITGGKLTVYLTYNNIANI